MSFALAVASIWISSCTAIGIALYYTHDIKCLWFLLIPALVNVSSSRDLKDGKENDVYEEADQE